MTAERSPADAAVLCDVMCGKLATLLRMCGYDAAYAMDRCVEADDRLLALAEREDRLLVTRDRQLAERAGERGVLLRSRDVDDQLAELRDAGFALSLTRPERCARCNAELERVPDGASLPEYVPDDADRVWRCPACGRHYWKGSHWDDVAARL